MSDLTVFCPFTRTWAVRPFFAALGASDVPFERARFVAYVDEADRKLVDAVKAAARALPFASVETHCSGVRPFPDALGAVRRRIRHATMREASMTLVDDGPLLLLEDDTLIPPDTFARLSETLAGCDWAIGAEVGRWGTVRPPGVWHFVREDGELVRKETVMPGTTATELVDATGFYCVLTTGAVYREMDCSTWSDMIGLDTHATWRLTEAGRRLMVDWRVPCIHITEGGHRLTMADATPLSMSLVGWEKAGLRTVKGRAHGAL